MSSSSAGRAEADLRGGRKLRVASYLRVSSQEQVNGYSLDAQRRALHHYCLAQDGKYEFVGEYRDEGVLAKSDDIEKRPAFKAAIEAVERGDIDALLVHKLDRFARNLLLALTVLKRIDFKLICLDPPVDFTSAVGRVQANIMMSFNQYYSDNLSDEVKKGLYERREQGLWLGQLPFGATRQPADGEGKLPPIPDRTVAVTDERGQQWSPYDVLQRIFRAAADGRSLAIICREVNALGFNLSQSSIHYILRNRFYLGELPVKGSNKNVVAEWKRGAHDAFIDPSLFDRAAASLETNRKGVAKVRRGARVYALTGLCSCGRCGAALHCDTVKERRRLHCYRRWKKLDCDQPTVKQQPVEDQLLVQLKSLRPSDDIIPQLLDVVRADPPDVTAERQRLERKRQKLKSLYLESDDLTMQDFKRETAEVDRQLALLEPVENGDQVTDDLLRYLRNFEDWWNDANAEERNALLRHILTKVVVDGDAVTAVGFAPQVDRLLRARLIVEPRRQNTASRPGSAATSPR